MIATNRRMPVHDFLLIVVSVAVILLSKWPDAPPRQRVQLRMADGTLCEYSLPENDPALAKLRLSLEKWARAGQETRLAVARWRAQLADHYVQRTSATADEGSGPFRTVSFLEGDPSDPGQQAEAETFRRSEREYWSRFREAARQEIASVEEIRRSRKALKVPPPIVFGRIQAGYKPLRAALISPLIGVIVALFFAAWAYQFPILRWATPESRQSQRESNITESTASSGPTESQLTELRLVVPETWVRIRQPVGVWARWAAMSAITLGAAGSILF